MRQCRICNDDLSGPSYKSYQTMCWSCFHKEKRGSGQISGGHIYIAEYWNMANDEAYPGYYKIGMTERDNAQSRIAELGDTKGVFKCRLVRHWAVNDPRVVEQVLHTKLNHLRVEGEWFEISKQEVIKICEDYIQATPTSQKIQTL